MRDRKCAYNCHDAEQDYAEEGESEDNEKDCGEFHLHVDLIKNYAHRQSMLRSGGLPQISRPQKHIQNEYFLLLSVDKVRD